MECAGDQKLSKSCITKAIKWPSSVPDIQHFEHTPAVRHRRVKDAVIVSYCIVLNGK